MIFTLFESYVDFKMFSDILVEWGGSL